MEKIIFERSYEVRSYDTGLNGKIRPDALLSYLQDIAGYHAAILGVGRDELNDQLRFWALVRIVYRLSSIPEWNDVITIKTWPASIEKLLAIRNFRIDNSDGRIIGEASSSWVVLDANTRRPLRPEAHLAELGQESPVEGFTCKGASKLPACAEDAYRAPIKAVKYSDLDINMHVNNAKYLQWVLDSYPLEFIRNNEAFVVEANYLSETIPGDEYTIMAEEKDNYFLHSVVKESSGKEACRIRIEWQS